MPENRNMETVLVTGGTGMIGKALTLLLTGNGYKVVVLTRKARVAEGNVSYAVWDINKGQVDENAVTSADHIVHLAGAGVADKRWTDKRKKEIVDSRVRSSGLIIKTLSENTHKVKTVVSASGIGWYGEDKPPKTPFTEDDPPANDFLGETCGLWEKSISYANQLGIRTVLLRTGIVLSKHGGAFPEFVKPMKAGVATIFSEGTQAVSWIHIDDIVHMYLAAIENRTMEGAYNAVASEVVSNKELILKIAKARQKPFIPVHVPRFMLKVALGEMSIEILKSATVGNAKIKKTGFNFIFPTIDSAINDLVESR